MFENDMWIKNILAGVVVFNRSVWQDRNSLVKCSQHPSEGPSTLIPTFPLCLTSSNIHVYLLSLSFPYRCIQWLNPSLNVPLLTKPFQVGPLELMVITLLPHLFSLCFPHLVLTKTVSPLLILYPLCSAKGNRFISCIARTPFHSRAWRKSKCPLVLIVIADHCSSCLSKLHHPQALKLCIQTISPPAIDIYGFPRHFSLFLGDVSFWTPVTFSKATLDKFLMIFFLST